MRKAMPKTGRPQAAVLDALRELKSMDVDWQRGRAPLYVFDAGQDVYEMGRAAFLEFFKENALGRARAFHSVKKMEDEVIEMGLGLLRGGADACGFMTTGGTESIIQAIQTCRNHERARRGDPGFRGNIVAARSAHPAFDKGAKLMDLEVRRAPVAPDLRADPAALESLIDEATMMLVGSAPCFPFGVIDPIGELSALARRHNIWLHVDSCVGGYLAPFVRLLGHDIPDFDFSVEGVTSISADLHKFGFCPKPASTVYYNRSDLGAFHSFEFTGWPNGRYFTDTLVGTRPAGGVAAAWAMFHYLGIEGYQRIATDLLALAADYRAGVEAIPGLKVLGDPHLTVIAFGSDELDVFRIAELMAEKGWLPGLLQEPRAIHRMMSLVHQPVLDEYLADLGEAAATVRRTAGERTSIEASY